MMKKEDIRVLKTKQKIKETFIELVEIKGYNYVHVSEIVKKAKINRNTFYLHYQDKEDLTRSLILETSKKIDLALGTHQTQIDISKITQTHVDWIIRKIFRLIEPEVEFYRIFMLDKSCGGFVREFYEMIKKHFYYLLNIKNPCSNLIFEYSFNGMIGLIQQWILYSPTTQLETSKTLAKLVYANLCQFDEVNA